MKRALAELSSATTQITLLAFLSFFARTVFIPPNGFMKKNVEMDGLRIIS